MKYLRKLIAQLTDESFLGIELMLAWIATMLTLLVLFSILYYFI